MRRLSWFSYYDSGVFWSSKVMHFISNIHKSMCIRCSEYY